MIQVGLTQRLTGDDVPMQVLRVLICPEVGDDPAGAMFGGDLGGDLADDGEHFEQEGVVLIRQVEQGCNVAFGDDDDVGRIGGASVVEGEDSKSLDDLLDGCVPTQDFVAVEVGWILRNDHHKLPTLVIPRRITAPQIRSNPGVPPSFRRRRRRC